MQDRKTLYVIGLMSGTSLDGIDAALVKIEPDLSCKFISGTSLDYSENMKLKINNLFSDSISPKFLCEMNFLIGEYFAKCTLKLVKETGITPDLIASHGITFYHNPTTETFENMPLNSTLQIGDGAVIAERTGVTTVCDFRPQDMAAGGQGAPLVPYADELFFSDKKLNRAVLNLGGIANVTVLSNNCDLFAFDTGPANMLIDMATKMFYNSPFDKDGNIAKSGAINSEMLSFLMNDNYLNIEPPKSTGRELYSKEYLNNIIEKFNDTPENLIATLTAYTVKSVKDAFDKFIYPQTTVDELIIGGGGAYNKFMLELFKNEFEPKTIIKSHEDFGILNKYKEAIAFALLGYTSYYGIPNNKKTATGAAKEIVLGKIIRKVYI